MHFTKKMKKFPHILTPPHHQKKFNNKEDICYIWIYINMDIYKYGYIENILSKV